MAEGDQRERLRQAFLTDAIDVLNRSLDYQETLAALAWIVVPTIADWCAIDTLEDGVLRRLAAAHMDPAKLELVKELEDRGATQRTAQWRVLSSGKPELSQITREMIEGSNEPEEIKQRIYALGLRSYLVVPLRRGDEIAGAITLATAESGRTFDDSDLSLAVQLGDRASVAIQHAHLFRQAERAVVASAAERDRLVQLIHAAPVAIGILRGRDLVVELVNTEFRKMFGGRDVIGMTGNDLDPEDKRMPEIRRIFDTGETQTHVEMPVAFDWSGTNIVETRYFNVTRAPLRDANGVIDAIVTWGLDVSDQVQARRRIEEAKLQAELANRAKDEFLAMLGHELRNPLAPITTALELMALRSQGQFQRERAVIERQLEHVTRLVDDLLDVSRITRGGVELHRETVDLADTVVKALEQASPLLEEKKHELITTVPRGILVNGDPMRLSQIVTNLVTNAAKYTKAGGQISIAIERDGDDAKIRVRDNGVGISPEILPRVFETFYQVRQSIDRSRGGLGLGLAIVRSLARAHGGEATATSNGLGAGSEFVITLPALDGRSIPRATGTPISGFRPLRPEKILLVDDNQDAISLLADALADRGFQTYVAHDAPSALVLAVKVKPQIALLDIGLPVMDGYELARRLHETDGLGDVQLVAITGYGHATDIAKSKAAGFAAHLVKPIGIDDVQAVIESLVLTARTSPLPAP